MAKYKRNWALWGQRVEAEFAGLRTIREKIEDGGNDEMIGLVLVGLGREGYDIAMVGELDENAEEAIEAARTEVLNKLRG